MDLWNDVSKKIGVAFDATAKGAEKLSDIAKAKYKLISAQNKRDSAFTAIGKLAYDERKTGCDNKEAIDRVYEEIDSLNEIIKSLKDEIRSLRNKKTCAACGKAIPAEDAFCPKCGALQPTPAAEEAPADEEAAEEAFEEAVGEDDID